MALHSWKMPRSLEKRRDLCAQAVQTCWGYTGSQEPALAVGRPNCNLVYLPECSACFTGGLEADTFSA